MGIQADQAGEVHQLREMAACGLHLGHRREFKNPRTSKRFVLFEKNGLEIIDISKTAQCLEKAQAFVRGIARDNGKIIFVGTKRSAQESIVKYARALNMPFVYWRWVAGLLTNYASVKTRVHRITELENMLADESFTETHTKREVLSYQRELVKLECSLGGVRDMKSLPDAIFVVDVSLHAIAVKEAVCLGIPVIGMVDTNNSCDNIDYVIPGNDDSRESINYVLERIAEAYQLGLQESQKKHTEVITSGTKKDVKIKVTTVRSATMKRAAKPAEEATAKDTEAKPAAAAKDSGAEKAKVTKVAKEKPAATAKKADDAEKPKVVRKAKVNLEADSDKQATKPAAKPVKKVAAKPAAKTTAKPAAKKVVKKPAAVKADKKDTDAE